MLMSINYNITNIHGFYDSLLIYQNMLYYCSNIVRKKGNMGNFEEVQTVNNYSVILNIDQCSIRFLN